MKGIEMRGDNPLKAVISGRESNAYIVAMNALANGVDHTTEQYNLDYNSVLGAIKFYLDNRANIDRLLDEVSESTMSLNEFKAYVEARREKG